MHKLNFVTSVSCITNEEEREREMGWTDTDVESLFMMHADQNDRLQSSREWKSVMPRG